ncbi:MAG: hypothetical protein G01um101431_612 [Parcubacteria group bacterium Gr01-1014_31]|nr:MAG: hypothetical protein G01um101431_612 [Parcubacteria group bacterium Gr01-1014_31]
MGSSERIGLFSRPVWIGIAAIGVIGLVFLLQDHTTHLVSVIPYVVLLLCPLLHIFMHRQHGGGQGHHGRDESPHNPHF